MQTAYVGESFELRFEMRDPDDDDKTPDSGTYVVRVDGAVTQSGTLGFDGRVGKFRFNPTMVGLHAIEIAYKIGDDTFKVPFTIDVREIARG